MSDAASACFVGDGTRLPWTRAGRRITCRNGPSATSAHSTNVWHSSRITGLASNSMGVSSHPSHSPAVARPVPDAGRRLSALALQPAMASLQRPNPNPVRFCLGMSIRTLLTCQSARWNQFPAMLLNSEIGANGGSTQRDEFSRKIRGSNHKFLPQQIADDPLRMQPAEVLPCSSNTACTEGDTDRNRKSCGPAPRWSIP